MIHPVIQPERTAVVDVLRGFALAGVVVANIATFVVFTLPAETMENLISTPADSVFEFIIGMCIDYRFVTLYSLLFGYGFGVIMERVDQKEMNPTAFFTRRMLLLLAAGIIHLLIWWGEILHTYAFCGLFLLFFRKVSDQLLLRWSIFLLIVPTTALRFCQIYFEVLPAATREQLMVDYGQMLLTPSLVSVVQANLKFYYTFFIQGLSEWRDAFEIMGKFLIGYYVLRKGFLKDLTRYAPSIRTMCWVCLLITLAFMGEMIYFRTHEGIRIEHIWIRLLIFSFNRFGILSNSLLYAGIIVLLYKRWSNAKVLSAFRYVGMMSLTNYLTQTFVLVVVFSGLGFGLLGKFNLIYTLVLAVVVYVAQAFFSKWWMGRYQYGPAEWLWRQASYGTRLPLRKTK